jgi:two-component system nitrogen regulation response regulator NtrX
MAGTILVVDDEEDILNSLKGIFSDEGYEVITATGGSEALSRIESSIPDLVLLDIWMPDMDGIETLRRIKEAYPSLPVIMMSGHGTIETAVRTTKEGAYDFVEKPLSLEKLILTASNALEHARLEQEVGLFRKKEEGRYNITGRSEAILQLKEQIRVVAPTNAWVLIMGENGTGKELVAHTIHRMSRRNSKPLVEVNCAAIPDDLIESELFGHEKGAFTGATTMKKGKFDLAHEGTIFLDEIGDMSLKAQSKTLRILQEQKFERVGGTRTIKVDVRVLAATNKNLEDERAKGSFREDLYFRLNVIPMRVPPLRERLDDIPELVKEFVQDCSVEANVPPKVFEDETLRLLRGYNWPGNVRELRNLVERLMIMTPGPVIRPEDLPLPYNKESSTPSVLTKAAFEGTLKEAKASFEKAYIEHKLREFKGNISQTADAIGIERSNLHRKIKAYGLDTLKDFGR